MIISLSEMINGSDRWGPHNSGNEDIRFCEFFQNIYRFEIDQRLKYEPISMLELRYLFTGLDHNLVAYIKKKKGGQTNSYIVTCNVSCCFGPKLIQ